MLEVRFTLIPHLEKTDFTDFFSALHQTFLLLGSQSDIDVDMMVRPPANPFTEKALIAQWQAKGYSPRMGTPRTNGPSWGRWYGPDAPALPETIEIRDLLLSWDKTMREFIEAVNTIYTIVATRDGDSHE